MTPVENLGRGILAPYIIEHHVWVGRQLRYRLIGSKYLLLNNSSKLTPSALSHIKRVRHLFVRARALSKHGLLEASVSK